MVRGMVTGLAETPDPFTTELLGNWAWEFCVSPVTRMEKITAKAPAIARGI